MEWRNGLTVKVHWFIIVEFKLSSFEIRDFAENLKYISLSQTVKFNS